ncbi:Glyoxalase/bleomycin resistance protein/dioxygenase [Catenulispora acidiphila DSM 44928]|uniref:Glyoxalase/bleomycin resistance protein/dioxygenase n=1 Tax=Catenulispora acidiphila (strain DSM 44928 / JCM 14897 / NBRC 102108 / NRRL B-24433 / ID139908) TaxID=479433 RepID=C7PWN6_CATAD|nr:VOC family protein [Catenulispora acidiphila]ACU75316.1 Glyoxalase/bleomycin resistance protein/dioxygenase [Catenulispora acidiphila DSM 44928]
MAITGLGHTGLWVYDLATMRRFYEHVMGLSVTDADDELGIVFLSARPEQEHHELVLQSGRTAPIGVKQQHQISWRVQSLDDLRNFHHRFETEGVTVQQEVTHGNALGIYFFDPEGNRNEVYLRIDRDVRQPFRKSIDFGRSPEEIYAEAERLLTDGGAAYRPVA